MAATILRALTVRDGFFPAFMGRSPTHEQHDHLMIPPTLGTVSSRV